MPNYKGFNDAHLAKEARRVVTYLSLAVLAFTLWAAWFEIEEVSSGQGKVIPTSREQIVQSLEGGILAELRVKEGDIVEKDQILAQLDPTRTESNVEETAARYRATLASVARLNAEITGAESITVPEALQDESALIARESKLLQARRQNLQEASSGLTEALTLIQEELAITRKLLKTGAASNVALLRLERERNDAESKLAALRTEFALRAQEELARANAEMQSLHSIMQGRSDSLTRLTHKSPVRGIVKDIEVTTIGGVIPPNGKLMAIVPLDDQLLIEARISPQDIAFIHPEQPALVKITAYDYSIYGALEGQVAMISPDTLRDEFKPEIFYYRVFIRTHADALVNPAGQRFPIVPGMVASVDIKTGSKTLASYLLKPINRGREALRER